MQEFVLIAVVMLLGMAAYWSMITFPKQRDFQKRQRFVRALRVGDEVVTFGGVIGKVVDIQADSGITFIEIAEGVVVRILSAAVMQAFDPEETARNAQRGMSGAEQQED